MRKILINIVLSIFPAYLILAFFLFSDTQGSEICKGVEVNVLDSVETPFIKRQEIERMIVQGGYHLKGKPMEEINTEKMEESLKKNQLINRAECYKTPGGVLRIDITQRVPLLRIMGVKGSFYVDNTGEYMPISRNFTSYLPIATGYVDKEFATNSLYVFAKFLQDDKFWNSQIEQIVVLPNYEIELIPRAGNHLIFLGKIDNFEQKLNKLMLLYQQALPKVGWDKYEMINLKYKNQVICTKRYN